MSDLPEIRRIKPTHVYQIETRCCKTGGWKYHSGHMRLYTGPSFMDLFALHLNDALALTGKDLDRIRITQHRIN